MSESTEPLHAIIEGVAAVAGLLSDDSKGASRWDAFEKKLREASEASPLDECVARFGLDSFELKCLLFALASHVEPRMPQLLAESGKSVFARGPSVRIAMEKFCATPEERMLARKSFFASGALVRHGLATLGAAEVGSSGELLARRHLRQR